MELVGTIIMDNAGLKTVEGTGDLWNVAEILKTLTHTL